jgi:hypothetical protein
MENKEFWTLRPDGSEILRDLKKENENFTLELFRKGDFDANNYQWYEMFHHYSFDDNGCDYERYGCYIKEGDVVLDLGANIGVFAHRAEVRGASKVICFEPVTQTFNCLIKNKGPKTLIYKNAVGSKNDFTTFNLNDWVTASFISVISPASSSSPLCILFTISLIAEKEIFNACKPSEKDS